MPLEVDGTPFENVNFYRRIIGRLLLFVNTYRSFEHFFLQASVFLNMQILINVSFEEKGGEWAIIELQGDLESRNHSETAGKFIGDLHFNQQKTPILIIGHHILHGKIVQLDKPFAVIEKVKTTNADSKVKNHNTKSVTYEVKTIVHKKLLFKTRPKPIIANVFAAPM